MSERTTTGAARVTCDLDPDTVLTVAEAAVGRRLVEAAVTECRAIYRPRVAATRGVYGVAGMARAAGAASGEPARHRAWEAVLKVLAPASGERLPFEASLYASGALSTLPGPWSRRAATA